MQRIESVFAPSAEERASYIVEGVLEIPEGVTVIGEDSFSDCREFYSIVFPSTLVSVGARAFARCLALEGVEFNDGLEEMELPASVTFIGRSAFQCCRSLLCARLGCAAKHIRPFTFSYCTALQEIILPDTLEYIGCAAFCGCSALREVAFPESLKAFDWVENESDGNTIHGVFEDCSSLRSIYIPEGVEKICDDIFKGCSALREVSIPSSVKTIGQMAFAGCSSLACVELHEGLETILGGAFGDCPSLCHIDIPDSVKEVDPGAFFDSGIPGSPKSEDF